MVMYIEKAITFLRLHCISSKLSGCYWCSIGGKRSPDRPHGIHTNELGSELYLLLFANENNSPHLDLNEECRKTNRGQSQSQPLHTSMPSNS